MFQKYVLRFTDTLSKHYAKHPALLAFGIDNESGDGPISYSETVRKRFVVWLTKKYSTIDKFDFLGKGNHSFQLIKDGKDSTSFSSEIIKVKKGDTLKIECLPRGGFVGVIK